MKCLFCGQDMWTETQSTGPYMLFADYRCFSIQCMINNDFPRYICLTDKDGNLCSQEYSGHNFYAKVSDQGTTIYRLRSAMLTEDVKVPEALWINPTNFEEALDKLQGLHYVLWNG